MKLFFNHKLTGADFRANKAWFEHRSPSNAPKINPGSKADRVPEIEVSFDCLIGADGAHSATRFHLMKFARVDYQQEYIDTLWCEFRIPPTENGGFRISPNHLHIWPGTDFMFIALPSSDKSFTCTLFAPSSQYAMLEHSPDDLFKFFDIQFPGVCPELITPEALMEQWTSNPHLPLISLKCKPHYFGSSAVIIGDAAHTVLPFYGQGLNAGLEDVRILFEHLDKYGVYTYSDLSRSCSCNTPPSQSTARQAALQAYNNQRTPDTLAINDLSKQNYLEMRSGVKSPLYKLRKSIEESLDYYLPRLGWKTQYARVSFSDQRYSEVVRSAQRQTLVLGAILGSVLFPAGGAVAVWMWRYPSDLWPASILRWSLLDVPMLWLTFFRNAAYK